jgi:hypothetical protein
LFLSYFELGYIYRSLNDHGQSANYFLYSAQLAKSRYRFDEWLKSMRQLSRSYRESGHLEPSREIIEQAYKYAKCCGDEHEKLLTEFKDAITETDLIESENDNNDSSLTNELIKK